MSIRPRTWWLLGGCGCALVALLVVGVAGLWYLWPSPAPPRKPPQDARGEGPAHRATPFYADKNREVPTAGGTVYTGRLEPGRDVTIRCDSTLSLTVPAGTFAGPQPVTVKAATVKSQTPRAVATTLASYEVTIGAGGPLSRPVTLTFTHAAVADRERLTAGRWDAEKEVWVPLHLTRRSATTSVVETDHLSYFTLDYWGLNGWQAGQSADTRVTVYVSTSGVPDPYPLFSRADGSGGKQVDRFTRALDEGGYADPSQPRPQRYLNDTARRGLYAKIVAEMVARIRSVYGSGEYGAPETLSVYVSDAFPNPVFRPALSGAYLGLPATGPKAASSPEDLAFNLAHEIFHACQYRVLVDTGGVTARWMAASMWLMDASAEYAAGRVAWADVGRRSFAEAGVVIDDATLRGKMGDKLKRDFVERQLTTTDSEHAYESSHFLEYMFERTRALAGLPTLWHLTRRAGTLDRSEQILQAYGRTADLPIEEIWSDFVPFLILDKDSPAQGELKTPHPLRQDVPSWSGPLALPAIYTGTYESFTLDPRPGEPASGSLRLTLEGPGVRVVVYRSALGELDLSKDLPTDRAFVTREPKVMVVPIRGHEMLFVVASRGDVKDPGLTLRAELTTLAVKATPLGGSKFRLEVEAPVTPQGPSRYRWDSGDPGASRAIETPTNTLEHTYSRPGEHEVKVTFLEGPNREPAGEAIGRVTVPSALKIEVQNEKTRRPLGGASVRLRYEGKTRSWGTDPSGVGRVDNVPPRMVSFSIEVSADGYETFAKTSEIDMSRELVVSKWVRLTPKPRVAPPRPAPPSEPPPPPAPAPEPPPVTTPTPKEAPKTPTPEDCMAKYRPRLAELRAHNSAQDPTSGSLVTRTMGVDAKCGATYNACIAAAKERTKSCRPGPDGTFTQCITTENRDWLTCANQEIDCCERALAAQCGMK